MGYRAVLLLAAFAVAWGCTRPGMWKAIPPPGGCEGCHTQRISSNWQVAYRPATLTDETDTPPWERPEAQLPPEPSVLEQQKVSEQRCFRCHKGPDEVHRQYRGRYHH